MKRISLLTTLLFTWLLLTGCNNNQYKEEFSEYWLLQWPNWTITLDDFEKAWALMNLEFFEEWKMCNTPELACVPIILKDDNTLITPHEHNTATEEFKDENIYFTNLETFRKVTWLKEASPEYVQQYVNHYSFDPYVKIYRTEKERKNLLRNCNYVYDPICWDDWNVYSNWCYLTAAWVSANNQLWVTNDNICENFSEESIYWHWVLKWFYNDIEDLSKYNLNTNLTISDEWIYAKFCNDFSITDYSLDWFLRVNEMSQTEIVCEWEIWNLLLNIEKEFAFLDGAIIYRQWNLLKINTTNRAYFIFEKSEEYN